MLEWLGLRDRRDILVFLCLVFLVAITPNGEEASKAVVLGIYRTVLLGIIVAYMAWSRAAAPQRICPVFLTAVTALFAAMAASVLLREGSRFDDAFVFYEKLLFAGAFIVLAHGATTRSHTWKRSVLGAVAAINVGYIAIAMAEGSPMRGPFVNPNYLASFVLPGIAVCAAFFSTTSSWKIRLAAASAGLFLYFGVLRTASRGATLAALALLGVAGLNLARRRGASWGRIAVVSALIAAVTVTANPTLIRKVLDRGERDPHNYMRLQVWLGTLSMIRENPITGVGLRQYYYEAKRFSPAAEGTVARYGRWPNIAHSEYLQAIAEMGIPAAALQFGLVGYLMLLIWRRSQTAAPENRVFQDAALLTATGLGVHGLVDNNWTIPVLAAGLAVISQADLLPYMGNARVRTPSLVWRTAAGMIFLVLWVESTLAPAIGFYLNDKGHEAYLQDDLERSQRFHRYALAVLPDHPVLIDNLGMVHFDEFVRTRKVKYLDRAESLFLLAMKQNPRYDLPATHLERTLLQRLTGDVAKDQPLHARIIEVDRHILRQDPFNALVRKNLAEALYQTGRRTEAYAELEQALRNEPNYVPAYLRMADWYMEDGRVEESKAYRKRAIEVVLHYQDNPASDPFEAILLGRPGAETGQP
jgi:O-antigen ligase